MLILTILQILLFLITSTVSVYIGAVLSPAGESLLTPLFHGIGVICTIIIMVLSIPIGVIDFLTYSKLKKQGNKYIRLILFGLFNIIIGIIPYIFVVGSSMKVIDLNL